MKSVKLNATMKEDLIARIDSYCAKSGMSRSGFLTVACNQYLDAVEKKPIVVDAFGHMGRLFKLALDGKTDSEEYAQALEELERSGDALKK